ncbi:hypothetical protein CWB89_06325 [Pseudoalteromonas piscicida]|uniref:Uncharacterized protein n=1 Tax=Pseudoalteromonas piscicida TaxID=43662 RepID=A0AAQ2EUC1_PSEO7|nr:MULTISPECIES: hypothetical protein [Pseudoalteromonas]KJY90367.1 hypothetical protein TW75_06940 [Pseudoalteromonas piscicida]TMN43612.1 hypothetical protein CWB95_05100 [Pseudoalteromonas piscicida]TMN44061.1 hypothetical protein CWB94_01550 [Pseudoalteromonas piscicida]TMN56822.1 hypothetical protein CWB92_01655 [Pseudoalteromonas piscicida]TMN57433.1 hypothetical protein CWB91_03510 [Pseudoalteromonas piscicida]
MNVRTHNTIFFYLPASLVFITFIFYGFWWGLASIFIGLIYLFIYGGVVTSIDKYDTQRREQEKYEQTDDWGRFKIDNKQDILLLLSDSYVLTKDKYHLLCSKWDQPLDILGLFGIECRRIFQNSFNIASAFSSAKRYGNQPDYFDRDDINNLYEILISIEDFDIEETFDFIDDNEQKRFLKEVFEDYFGKDFNTGYKKVFLELLDYPWNSDYRAFALSFNYGLKDDNNGTVIFSNYIDEINGWIIKGNSGSVKLSTMESYLDDLCGFLDFEVSFTYKSGNLIMVKKIEQ